MSTWLEMLRRGGLEALLAPRRKGQGPASWLDKATETLQEVVGEFRFQQALDLLEQTLAWNALLQFLPDESARNDAEAAETRSGA